jgi:hypothetical protein
VEATPKLPKPAATLAQAAILRAAHGAVKPAGPGAPAIPPKTN